MNQKEPKRWEVEFLVEESALDSVAAEIIGRVGMPAIGCFSGDLGAGKTTLIKALCRTLGVEEHVTSPTFSLVQEYRTSENRAVYHLDLYRIESSDELLQIGIEEIFDSGCWTFVEWPEIAAGILPAHHFTISMRVESEHLRKIVFSINESGDYVR